MAQEIAQICTPPSTSSQLVVIVLVAGISLYPYGLFVPANIACGDIMVKLYHVTTGAPISTSMDVVQKVTNSLLFGPSNTLTTDGNLVSYSPDAV